MNAAPKYRATWTDRLGQVVTLTLLVTGYSGAVSAFGLGRPGLQRIDSRAEGDITEPLKPWGIVILTDPASESIVADFYTSSAKWYVEVHVDGELDLRGELGHEYRAGSLDEKPRGNRLIARCGLGALEAPIMYPEVLLGLGRQSVLYWIQYCLSFIGTELPLATASNWFAGGMTGGDPLTQEFITADRWVAPSSEQSPLGRKLYYTVPRDALVQVSLADILRDLVGSKGAYIHQRYGYWHVVQRKRHLSTSYGRHLYPAFWYLNGTGASTDVYAGRTVVSAPSHGRGGSFKDHEPIAQFDVLYRHGAVESLIPNGNFELFDRSGGLFNAVPEAWTLGGAAQIIAKDSGISGGSISYNHAARLPVLNFFELTGTPTSLLGTDFCRMQDAVDVDFGTDIDLVLTVKVEVVLNEEGESELEAESYPFFAYLHITQQVGGTTYYAANTGTAGVAQWTTAQLYYKAVAGFADNNLITVRLPALAGATDLRVTLYNVVQEIPKRITQPFDLEFIPPLYANHVWYDDLVVLPDSGDDSTSADATLYRLAVNQGLPFSLLGGGGEARRVEIQHGTGPSRMHHGAALSSTGNVLTDWGEGASEAGVLVQQLLGRYWMAQMANGWREKQLRYPKTVQVSLLGALTDFGGLFLPTSITEDYITREKDVTMLELYDSPPVATMEVSQEQGGNVVGGSGSSSGIALTQRAGTSAARLTALLNATALTVLSANLSASVAVVSIPIKAIGTKATKKRAFQGDVLYLIDQSGTLHELAVQADVVETATAIGITSFAPEATINAGSAVYLLKRHDLDNATRGGFQVDEGVTVYGTGDPEHATQPGEVEHRKPVWWTKIGRFLNRLVVGTPSIDVDTLDDGDAVVARDLHVERDQHLTRKLILKAYAAAAHIGKVLRIKDDTGEVEAHTLAVADVDGLPDALADKADDTHTHQLGDVDGLQSALDGKAATTHSHAIDDVTDLQPALNGKANFTHTHTVSDITDFPAEQTLSVVTAVDFGAETVTTQSLTYRGQAPT